MIEVSTKDARCGVHGQQIVQLSGVCGIPEYESARELAVLMPQERGADLMQSEESIIRLQLIVAPVDPLLNECQLRSVLWNSRPPPTPHQSEHFE